MEIRFCFPRSFRLSFRRGGHFILYVESSAYFFSLCRYVASSVGNAEQETRIELHSPSNSLLDML